MSMLLRKPDLLVELSGAVLRSLSNPEAELYLFPVEKGMRFLLWGKWIYVWRDEPCRHAAGSVSLT